jgi:predicted negative regulator of RcsB-dependent stress response
MKRRPAAKAPRVETKLPTLAGHLGRWWGERKPWILGGIAVILILLGVLWGVRNHQESRERRAVLAYAGEAYHWPEQENADQEKIKELIPKIQEFIGKFDGTGAAARARLDMARAFLSAGRFDEAITAGKEALKELSSNGDLRMLARYQLTLAYLASGRAEEALAQWAAVKNGALSGMEREIRWKEGLLLAKRGEYAMALEQYELAVKAKGSYPADALLEMELADAKAQAASAAPSPSGKGS